MDNIITLVNAVLLEKQLVVFCPHIGTLGSVVLSLVPLLRPFTWQSLMMPVTPVSMLGFLDAPVPFVLGVQYKTPDVAGRYGLWPSMRCHHCTSKPQPAVSAWRCKVPAAADVIISGPCPEYVHGAWP